VHELWKVAVGICGNDVKVIRHCDVRMEPDREALGGVGEAEFHDLGYLAGRAEQKLTLQATARK
jgi:hypothetical protein